MNSDENKTTTRLDQQGVPFGRYRLLRKIATGGMAQLYLASISGAANFQKFCVIKKILPHLAEQKRFVDMFLDEARIAAGLSHPNIVSIFDLGQVGQAYFIAMEYIAGEDLAHLIGQAKNPRQHLPIELCAKMAADICAGLHYAHEQSDSAGHPLNIVHRDVSPQNILLTYEGQIKIVDFGIAKAANKVAHTRTGAIMGKAAYMSPEQCLGQDLDRRSDVFAVGVLLHELLSLQRLYKRPSELLTLRAITEEDAPAIASLRPQIPEILNEIVATALQRDKSKRYDSCLQMRSALEHFIADFGVPATSLELGDLLEQHFPGHAKKRKRIHEAGSLSEVIMALPDAGLPDLGTPSVQSANMLTLTDTASSSGTIARPKKRSFPTLFALGLLLIIGVLAIGSVWILSPKKTTTAVKTGSLVITSEPHQAQVRLDGKLRGHCPMTLSHLQLGQAYRLELSASGFQTHRANLYLDKQRPNVEQHIALQAEIKNQQTSLQVESSPIGASIFIDNQDTGQQSPCLIADLAPGLEHEIRVSLKGYKVERRRFMPRAGETTVIKLQLEKLSQPKNSVVTRRRTHTKQPNIPIADPAVLNKKSGFGFLNLRTEPWTQVFDGAVELGETPLFKIKLSVGKHRLRVRNKNKNIDSVVVVSIEKDKVTTLSKKLLSKAKAAQ